METIRKKLRTISLLVCLFWCGLCGWQLAVGVQEVVKTDTTEWRLTKNGWQDASTWAISWNEGSRLIDHVHPFVVAGMILLTVVGACVWAASEWEVDRLFRRTRELTPLERTKKWVSDHGGDVNRTDES